MPFGSGGTYSGSMAGSGSIGGNPGNSLQLLLQRLMALRQQQGGGAMPAGADGAMARMFGMPGAPGVQRNMQLGWRPPGSAAGLPPKLMAGGGMGSGVQYAGGSATFNEGIPRRAGIGLGGW